MAQVWHAVVRDTHGETVCAGPLFFRGCPTEQPGWVNARAGGRAGSEAKGQVRRRRCIGRWVGWWCVQTGDRRREHRRIEEEIAIWSDGEVDRVAGIDRHIASELVR